MTQLLAFHGDRQLRDDMLDEIRWHAEQDKIIQGSYADDGKFCAVGCSVESLNKNRGKNYRHGDHIAYETELGIPELIARLEDRIFEGLEPDEAKTFPLRFMEAVKLNADLSLVGPKFFVWLLTDEKDGVLQFAFDDGKAAITEVAALYQRIIDGGKVSQTDWNEAIDRAAEAAEAAEAAWAAWAAEAAWAAWAAWAAHYRKMADKLIELLADAPVREKTK